MENRRERTLELFEKVTGLIATPSPEDRRDKTALLVFLGGGNWHTCDLRLQVPWPIFTDKVWVAGMREENCIDYDLEVVKKQLMRGGRYPSHLRNQGWVELLNTRDQMLFAVEQVRSDATINHLVLSTAKYHVVRCALTFMKMWLQEGDGRNLDISILPTSDPNKEEVADVVGTNTLPEAELDRIEIYQDKGDVATAEDLERFL